LAFFCFPARHSLIASCNFCLIPLLVSRCSLCFAFFLSLILSILCRGFFFQRIKSTFSSRVFSLASEGYLWFLVSELPFWEVQPPCVLTQVINIKVDSFFLANSHNCPPFSSFLFLPSATGRSAVGSVAFWKLAQPGPLWLLVQLRAVEASGCSEILPPGKQKSRFSPSAPEEGIPKELVPGRSSGCWSRGRLAVGRGPGQRWEHPGGVRKGLGVTAGGQGEAPGRGGCSGVWKAAWFYSVRRKTAL